MAAEPPIRLAEITTRWSAVHEPERFVLRYAPAIRRYLAHVVPDPHAADDVLQEFLLHISRGGFQQVHATSGKFRHYLIRALRNAIVDYYRKHQRHPTAGLPEHLGEPASDDVWLREWQRCLIERTWAALADLERTHPQNVAHTLLRLRAEHPDADGRTLTQLLNQQTGQTMQEAAVRKQLSRARRTFAEQLIAEVAATMDHPSPATLRNELIEGGLMRYVEPYLADVE